MDLFSFIGSSESSAPNDDRLRIIEKKLDMILQHLGLGYAEEELEEVRRLLQDGQKIEAIKLFREITGVGLKEAKDAVERGV